MNQGKKMLGMLLVTGVAACVQNTAGAQTSSVPAKPETGTGTDDRRTLEQLNAKYDAMMKKIDQMQSRLDALEKQAVTQETELNASRQDAAAARADALDAKQQLKAAAAVAASAGSSGAGTVSQAEFAALKETSAGLTAAVVQTQAKTAKLENPDTLHFKGIELRPGGFAAAETVDRQHGTASDVSTPFSAIPFSGQTASNLSEFNASARQSRISLLAEGKLPAATLRAYYEADFLSAGTTSNNNQSNSYTLRQRQVWAQAELEHGWTFTAGQMWSLATEYRHGLDNTAEAIPLTIDSQYNVGFTWERQYGLRIVKKIGDKMWIGGSLEEAQTLNIGGHNLPTIAYQASGTSAGLYNSTANYSFNYAPDLLLKIAYEPRWGHVELFGVGRLYRDRIFPNGPAPTSAPQPPTTSALGAHTSKTEGGGIGLNARVPLMTGKLSLGGHILAGNGLGRYSTGTLPDATAHPDGSLELLVGGSALGSVEYRATPRLDLYGYYGGEYAKRAFYSTGYANTTTGQPILGGYGAPTNDVSGCQVETLPNGGLASGASATTCVADTRNLQEGTVGYWFRFYKGTRGTFQQGFQYSYVVRHTWEGTGPVTGLGFSPKAIENMWFTSFRFYLPQ